MELVNNYKLQFIRKKENKLKWIKDFKIKKKEAFKMNQLKAGTFLIVLGNLLYLVFTFFQEMKQVILENLVVVY